jgi:hypothetical protein
MSSSKKAAKSRAAQANSAAQALAANPYVQRLIQDDDLRSEVKSAAATARKAYGRLSNGKAPASALLNDKKLQRDLRDTANSLRKVSDSIRQGPSKRRRRSGGLGRKLLLLFAAVAIGLAVSEPARKKVLDSLFGAEEEFDYTSTTAPATPAPNPVATS